MQTIKYQTDRKRVNAVIHIEAQKAGMDKDQLEALVQTFIGKRSIPLEVIPEKYSVTMLTDDEANSLLFSIRAAQSKKSVHATKQASIFATPGQRSAIKKITRHIFFWKEQNIYEYLLREAKFDISKLQCKDEGTRAAVNEVIEKLTKKEAFFIIQKLDKIQARNKSKFNKSKPAFAAG